MLILIGIIGCLLIVFSLLLFWTAYNSHKEKIALQEMMMVRRVSFQRTMELERQQFERERLQRAAAPNRRQRRPIHQSSGSSESYGEEGEEEVEE